MAPTAVAGLRHYDIMGSRCNALGGVRINRAQEYDGTAILAFLIPVFVDVMLDNPPENRERPFYPVIAE